MSNYIVNGDFSKGLAGWGPISEGHPKVVVKGEDGSHYAGFVANAQLVRRQPVAVPRHVKCSMRVEVEGGSNLITGGIQLLIAFWDAGQLSVSGYGIKEFPTWGTAEVDLHLGGGKGPVEIMVYLLVQPNFKKLVSITDIEVTDALRPFRSSSTEELKAPKLPEGFTMPPAKA